MDDERRTVEEMEEELQEVTGKIEQAVRAGDVAKVIQLRARKSVLPVLIGNKQLAALEEELAQKQSASEDLFTTVKDKRAEVEEARTAVKAAESLLKDAESALNLADGNRVRNGMKIEALHKQINAVKSRIEAAVSAATG